MKIAFDENMPAAVVRTFQTLAAERGFKTLFRRIHIVSAKDYTPHPTDLDYVKGRGSDSPWMRRFKKDGGKVVISGNTKMLKVPQEYLAIHDCGLVVIFFHEGWNQWRISRKSAFILAWLERILTQSRRAKSGSIYKIPNNWQDDANFTVIPPPTPLKFVESGYPMRDRKAVQEVVPKPRRRSEFDSAQGFLQLSSGTEPK